SAALAAWLRRLLAYNIADALRALHRGKRDVARERSLEAELTTSSIRLGNWLAAVGSSPSQRVMREEQRLRLADAMNQLPAAQREALLMHYVQGMALAVIATDLGRTPAAVAGLLQRGLKSLRTLLAEQE